MDFEIFIPKFNTQKIMNFAVFRPKFNTQKIVNFVNLKPSLILKTLRILQYLDVGCWPLKVWIFLEIFSNEQQKIGVKPCLQLEYINSVIIKIYTAKSRLSIPKLQRCLLPCFGSLTSLPKGNLDQNLTRGHHMWMADSSLQNVITMTWLGCAMVEIPFFEYECTWNRRGCNLGLNL